MKKITIKDIAQKADVSVATVSYVLNNNRYVSPELKSRVNEAIAELGYMPNAVARNLRQSRTRTLGLIIPDNSNPFYAEIAKGVEDAGFEAGYSVSLCNSNGMLERELAYVEMLQANQVDGIIFISTTTEIQHIQPLVNRGMPVVMFYRDAGDLNVDTFKIDNHLAGYLATRHLVELGHQRIACIRPISDTNPSGQRVGGYKAALEENGLTWNPALMPRGDNLIVGGANATLELLSSGEPFTAIYASNDAMAIGAIRVLRTQGFRVPEDISIVGTDDILLASYYEPALTTVAQLKQEAGSIAVQSLLERIDGRYEGGARETMMDIRLVIRQSAIPYEGS
jgi:LacI family transcriptional regulator